MKSRTLDIHLVLTSLLSLLMVAAYIFWVTLRSECPTEEFILVTLGVPMCILLAAHGVASHWPAFRTDSTLFINVRPIICVGIGYIAAFAAFEMCMAKYGYSRFFWSVLAELLIWVLIAVVVISLRLYGAIKLAENDML